MASSTTAAAAPSLPADEPLDMDALVNEIVAASNIPPRSRQTPLKPAIASLASLAYTSGLPPAALATVVALTSSRSRLDQAGAGALVRNLYPAAAVPQDAVLRVIGCLGFGRLRPALLVQALLLRWLVLVYHVLDADSRRLLASGYAVMFNLLDAAAIRPQLCHVLALVTRRKHVRPFRIQALLELSRQTGGDPAIIGLLRVYKDYYPEIIVSDAVRGRASVFKHPDPQWRAHLDSIRLVHAQQEASHDPLSSSHALPRNGFRTVRAPPGLSRPVPGVRTSHATETSLTLEEVDSAAALVAGLERVQMPDQLVAVLADPLLQKLLQLRGGEEAERRIAGWLSAAVRDELENGGAVGPVLEGVRDYMVRTTEFPTVLLMLLKDFLPGWDGRDGRQVMVDLLCYLPLLPFRDLYNHILEPFENALCQVSPSAASQLLLLELYTRLLRRWTTVLLSTPLASSPEHSSDTVNEFVTHVGTLCLTLVQTANTSNTGSSPSTIAVHSSVIAFYNLSAALAAEPTLLPRTRIVPPPAAVVYMLLFSPSAVVLSSFCAVLAGYKRAVELSLARVESRPPGSGLDVNATEVGPDGGDDGRHGPSSDVSEFLVKTYDRAFVNAFNSFLMDTCNCIWRGRAFLVDVNSRGCLVATPVVKRLTAYVAGLEPALDLPVLFGLSHSPTLCLQAIESLRAIEDARTRDGDSISVRHAGPATQRSLQKLGDEGGVRLTWQEYRIGVLRSLEEKGMGGVAELMRNTMKILMNAKA